MPTKLAPGIREKRPGYFEIRVYGGKDPITGKVRQVSRTVRGSVKDANRVRAELMTEIERSGAGSDRSLGELFNAVLTHLEALGREERTLMSYRQIARDSAEVLGNKSLRKLAASDLDRFYASLLTEGRSPATARRYHGFIRRSLAQGVKWDWVAGNVADRASPPKEPKRTVDIQPAEAVVRLIQAADTSREPELGLAFRLLAATGCRRGELCGLQWGDVDFNSGVLRIRRSVKHIKQGIVVGDVKTHQERSVQLDETTLELLASARQEKTDAAALAGMDLAGASFILTDSPYGSEPWKPNRLTQAFGRLKERAGFEGRLHDIRHWHASQLLASGEPGIVVAERLGHLPDTLHKVYAHAFPRSDQNAAVVIAKALSDRVTSSDPPNDYV